MKSWTFINLPRRADCLEPGSVFLPLPATPPPLSLSHCINGIQRDWARAAVSGRQTRVTANNQALDASPRYWQRGGGDQGIPEDIRDRGQAVGLTAEVKRSSHGHASRSIAQLMLL